MITPTKEPKLEDTTLEPKEKDTPQPATHTVPTLASYTNLEKLKTEGFLEQQSVIILIHAGSTHNFISTSEGSFANGSSSTSSLGYLALKRTEGTLPELVVRTTQQPRPPLPSSPLQATPPQLVG
ncbi:hypothetical protein BHM03_00035229 [Ensete ventricosum]|nr:hypothetical protein BHM03_00035229 [Ensete ventricosum]